MARHLVDHRGKAHPVLTGGPDSGHLKVRVSEFVHELDGGIGDVLDELSSLIAVLEDVANLFEETKAVWELYEAMP